MRRACVCLAFALTLAVALPARAQETPRRSIEGALCGGWGVTTQGAEGASKERSNHNGGLAFAGRLSFGSSYFIRPFFEAGWTPITASREVTRINGGPEKIDSSLSMWSFSAGPSVDLWRRRFRVGAGFSLLRAQVTSTMSDVTITPSEWGMAYAFYLSGFVYQRKWFRTGLDVRFITSTEIGISHLLFGVLLAGDALSW